MKAKLTMMLAAVAAMLAANVTLADEDAGPKGAVQLWADGPYWATTNIGAEEPEDYGYYFWWGDTLGYKRENEQWVASDGSASGFSFSDANAQTWVKDIATLQSEGWITAEGVLAPEHDAAHVQWGGSWRMPTDQELQDLVVNCEWTQTTVNGVNGYNVRGKGAYASARIFLPAAGYGGGSSLYNAGSYGLYWSSVPFSDSNFYLSWYLNVNSSSHYTSYSYRDLGFSVRPVRMTPLTPPPAPAKPAPTLFTAISGTTVVGGGEPELDVASVWDGWIEDDSGIVGTVQVKVGKATAKKPAKVTASVVLKDSTKKLSFKGEMAADATEAMLTCKGQSDMSLSFGERALAGEWSGKNIIGGRNLFSSKDKAEAKEADALLAPWKGALNAAWDGGTLSVSIAAKGKAKVSAVLADGTKATANGQFVIGDDWCAVPVVVNKKAKLGFIVWLSLDGEEASVEGLGDGVEIGMPAPGASLAFTLGGGFDGIEGLQTALLPANGYAFEGGAKWKFKTADTVKLNADKTAAEVTKDNGNPSGLKLTYTAKTGAFKGKFTVYAVQGGKLKKLTANVTGVMVGKTGLGIATVKGVGSVAVTVE